MIGCKASVPAQYIEVTTKIEIVTFSCNNVMMVIILISERIYENPNKATTFETIKFQK